jgi:hypothetical protein
MPNTDTYFHKRLDHCTTKTWVRLNLQYFRLWKGTVRRIAMASSLLNFVVLGWICQHCGAPFVDSAYRVNSEDSGVVLLDIIVCQHCYVEAA